MKKEPEVFDESTEEEEQFAEFSQLRETAPDDIFPRLQKRVRTAQLGKDLIEKQAMGFWAVIDAFLKLFFAPKKGNKEINEKPDTGEK